MSTHYQSSHLTASDKRALAQFFYFYPNPIPSLKNLVKWAKRLIHKVRLFQMKHNTVRRYFQSMRNYFKYYNLDSSVFRAAPLVQRLDFQLRRMPVRYFHKERIIVSLRHLHRAAQYTITNGSKPTDVMTVAFATLAFASLARTHELVHAPSHSPLLWANVHKTNNNRAKILLQQPKIHKGYNQYLEPLALHSSINPHSWLEKLRAITGKTGCVFSLDLHGKRPSTRSMLNNFATLASLNPKHLDSSSFRAGGATYLLHKGCSDAQIMRFGRWDSKAYTRYLRTLDDAFLHL